MAESLVLAHSPSVHFLCRGAFLQHAHDLAPDVVATPLAPLGFRGEAGYAVDFSEQVLSRKLHPRDASHLVRMGDSEQPCLVITVLRTVDAPGEELISATFSTFERARNTVSWICSETPELFAVIVHRTEGPEFSLRPQFTRRKQKLVLVGDSENLRTTPRQLFAAAAVDERFSFALTMYRDALRDTDTEFRISRFFMCLESLAYRLKAGGLRSRTAVRRLLGIQDVPLPPHTLPDGRVVSVDRVEIGGRIRDKIFHGVPFSTADLNDEAAAYYDWARTHPGYLRDLLASDCELELTKWANGTSAGLV